MQKSKQGVRKFVVFTLVKKMVRLQVYPVPFEPFKPSGLFYLNSLDRSISFIRGVWLNFIIVMFCKNF